MCAGGGVVNQIIEWLAVSGVVLAAFAVVFSYAGDHIGIVAISQHDKIELEKRKASEQLRLIDVVDNPLRIDVMNVGLEEIKIKKLYIGDTSDDSYTITDRYGNSLLVLPKDELVQITPSLSGTGIKIISKNNKIFSFE